MFGSLAGFGSYVFLLKHATPARASTYAFVNPLAAVVLGSLLAGEAIGPRTGVAALLIVSAVGAVIWGSGARRSTGSPRTTSGRSSTTCSSPTRSSRCTLTT